MSYQNGIINHLIENEIEISFPDNDEATITQANIVSESMTLKQSICDSAELRFGGCIASEFNIKLMNTPERQFSSQLVGKWISVKITQHYSDPDELIYPSGSLYPSDSLYPGYALGSQSFYIFSGYIDSAPVDKTDKNIFNIVAYDVMTKLYEEDITNWLYNEWKSFQRGTALTSLIEQCLRYGAPAVTIPTNSGAGTVFNSIFYEYMNYLPSVIWTRTCDYTQRNNDWANNKSEINKGTLLKYLCEALGAFGVIRPNSGKGVFDLVKLSGTPETYGFYERLETEDYQSTGYNDFMFDVSGSNTNKTVTGVYTKNGALTGGISDAYDNAFEKTYDFTDNILLWEEVASTGRTQTNTDCLINNSSIGTRLALNAESEDHSGECAFSTYQPLSASLDARLWVTVGSPIEILVSKTDVSGNYIDNNGNIITDGTIVKESVKTYVLSRTITGIQAMTDKIEVKGVR